MKQTRYLFKQTERGGESERPKKEEKMGTGELRCSNALKEKTVRWVKISPPFSEQRPIQLKLDQSTQMCLVSGYQIQQGQGVGRGRKDKRISYNTIFTHVMRLQMGAGKMISCKRSRKVIPLGKEIQTIVSNRPLREHLVILGRWELYTLTVVQHFLLNLHQCKLVV